MSAEPQKKRRNIRSRILAERLNLIRQRIASGWSNPAIITWAEKEWGITSRTTERYISTVYADTRAVMEKEKPMIAARLFMELDAFYRSAMKAKRFEAAGRYFDRMMRLCGIETHRVELSGRDGKPIEVTKRRDLSKMPDDKLDALEAALDLLEAAEADSPDTTH